MEGGGCVGVDLLSLDVGDVEERSVEVDKLEDVHLCDEAVVVIRLSPVQLCGNKTRP